MSTFKELDIQISMEGKGKATDNTFFELSFQALKKRRHIYFYPANHGLEQFVELMNF